MRRYLNAVCIFALFSCGTMNKAADFSTPMTIIKATLGATPETSDPFEIVNAWIEGNYMHVSVRYSGGCGEHTFQCIGSLQISKSLPPRRSLALIHTNHEDFCKKNISDTLIVDLKALTYQQTEGSEILLDLMNWKSPLLYVYTNKEVK